jgi:hypothetical protein
MSEIVDDLKISNLEVTSNLGLRLSGSAPEIKSTQTLAPLVVTSGGDLTLESTAGAVNVKADGRIDLNSDDVVVGNPAGTVDIDSNTVVIGNPAGTVNIDSDNVTIGNPAGITGTVDIDSDRVIIGNSAGRIGFFGTTPALKQTTAAFDGTPNDDAVLRNSTFDGYMIDDIVAALKAYGLLA